MGFIFKQFKIIGIDLSQYNDNPNTPQVVDAQKVKDTGIDFVAMRSTVGKWLDPKFKQFWAALRGFVLRIQYHYMDYYSHGRLGLTAAQWGQAQAQAVFDSTKDDNDGCIAFLDIEKASFAAKIEDVLPLVNEIAKAFLVKLDALNGKKNGLYLSLSYLEYFLFAKDRPLWLALYNEYYTPEQAVALTREKGWTGPVYMWQYTSDGDIDDDGTADGLKIGVESAAVDLNIWVASEEEFKNFGKVAIMNPNPVDPPAADTFWAKCTATSLYIRSLPSMTGTILGTLSKGNERMVYDVLNGWYRIGEGKWVSAYYMQKMDTPIVEPPPTVIIPSLAVPAFSQKDTGWANDRLGTSSKTIGSDGCLLTAVASICRYFGKATDPAVLNRDLNRVNGYETLNLLVYDAVTSIYPNIVVDWLNFLKDGEVTDAKIDAVLASKRPVIAQVDYNPSTTALEPHWVVIKGKNSNGYVILDTWDGATVDLNTRYKKLLRMVVFSHTTEAPVEATDAERLARLWAAHPELHTERTA